MAGKSKFMSSRVDRLSSLPPRLLLRSLLPLPLPPPPAFASCLCLLHPASALLLPLPTVLRPKAWHCACTVPFGMRRPQGRGPALEFWANLTPNVSVAAVQTFTGPAHVYHFDRVDPAPLTVLLMVAILLRCCCVSDSTGRIDQQS